MDGSAKPLGQLTRKHLWLISAIDDTGSLKQAAEKIAMSQPRATKALQEAVNLSGHMLFHR